MHKKLLFSIIFVSFAAICENYFDYGGTSYRLSETYNNLHRINGWDKDTLYTVGIENIYCTRPIFQELAQYRNMQYDAEKTFFINIKTKEKIDIKNDVQINSYTIKVKSPDVIYFTSAQEFTDWVRGQFFGQN